MSQTHRALLCLGQLPQDTGPPHPLYRYCLQPLTPPSGQELPTVHPAVFVTGQMPASVSLARVSAVSVNWAQVGRPWGVWGPLPHPLPGSGTSCGERFPSKRTLCWPLWFAPETEVVDGSAPSIPRSLPAPGEEVQAPQAPAHPHEPRRRVGWRLQRPLQAAMGFPARPPLDQVFALVFKLNSPSFSPTKMPRGGPRSQRRAVSPGLRVGHLLTAGSGTESWQRSEVRKQWLGRGLGGVLQPHLWVASPSAAALWAWGCLGIQFSGDQSPRLKSWGPPACCPQPCRLGCWQPGWVVGGPVCASSFCVSSQT